MRWVDALTDPEGILRVYQGTPPELAAVRVHEVCAHRDGPRLVLRVDLPTFPADPPVKWRHSGFNTVQVTLLLGGVRDLSLAGISTEITADLSLVRRDDDVRLELKSPVMRVTATAAFATLTAVSAYLDGGQH